MSFLAKLELGDKEYNILSADYDISQPIDHYGRPHGKAKGGLVQLTIESSTDNQLVEWASKHSLMKDGKLIFYRRDANSQMKTVKFKDAFCIYLKEIFTADGANPMVTRLTISARELTIASITIANPWAGSTSNAKDDDATNHGGSNISSFKAAGDDEEH